MPSPTLIFTFSGSPGARRVVEPSEPNSQRNTFDFFRHTGQRVPPASASSEPITRTQPGRSSSEVLYYFFRFQRQPESFDFLVTAAGLTSTGLPLSWRVLIFAHFSPASNRNFRFLSTLTVSGERLVASGTGGYLEAKERQPRSFNFLGGLSCRSEDRRSKHPLVSEWVRIVLSHPGSVNRLFEVFCDACPSPQSWVSGAQF